MRALLLPWAPLLRDKEASARQAGDEKGKEAHLAPQFEEEQLLVANVVHLMRNDNTKVLLRILVHERRRAVHPVHAGSIGVCGPQPRAAGTRASSSRGGRR